MRFGGVKALDGLSFAVEEGQIVGLIGPNGAGKTTVFNLISRFYDPVGGRIRFRGEDLLRLKPHQVLERGIARTFQNLGLFPYMTVLENLLVGRHIHYKAGRGPWPSGWAGERNGPSGPRRRGSWIGSG
jgi:branched-chain amino acid transport system ATP-binding protein